VDNPEFLTVLQSFLFPPDDVSYLDSDNNPYSNLDQWLTATIESEEQAEELLPNFISEYGGVGDFPPYVISTYYRWGPGINREGHYLITNVSGNVLSVIGENPLENYYSVPFEEGDTLFFKNSDGIDLLVTIVSGQYYFYNTPLDESEFPMVTDIPIPNGTAFIFRPVERANGQYGEFNFS
jgi:hypothetical protein